LIHPNTTMLSVQHLHAVSSGRRNALHTNTKSRETNKLPSNSSVDKVTLFSGATLDFAIDIEHEYVPSPAGILTYTTAP